MGLKTVISTFSTDDYTKFINYLTKKIEETM